MEGRKTAEFGAQEQWWKHVAPGSGNWWLRPMSIPDASLLSQPRPQTLNPQGTAPQVSAEDTGGSPSQSKEGSRG